MTDEELRTGWSQDAAKPAEGVHYGSWSNSIEIYNFAGARKEWDEQLENKKLQNCTVQKDEAELGTY